MQSLAGWSFLLRWPTFWIVSFQNFTLLSFLIGFLICIKSLSRDSKQPIWIKEEREFIFYSFSTVIIWKKSTNHHVTDSKPWSLEFCRLMPIKKNLAMWYLLAPSNLENHLGNTSKENSSFAGTTPLVENPSGNILWVIEYMFWKITWKMNWQHTLTPSNHIDDSDII